MGGSPPTVVIKKKKHRQYKYTPVYQWLYNMRRREWEKGGKIIQKRGTRLTICPSNTEANHLLVNKATSAHLYPIYLHSTSDCKAQSQGRQTTIVITPPMEHIQDPVDEPPTPFKGRNPQRGRAVERKTRRSKRGDHGLATRHLVRRRNQRSWKITGQRDTQ